MGAEHPARVRSRFFELGACSKCMRTSFLVALFSLVIAVFATLIFRSFWISAASGLIAGASIGLWVCHLGAYALREARLASRDPQASLFVGRAAAAEPAPGPRRLFLATTIKAFGFAALATIIPGAVAFAQTAVGHDCKIQNCWQQDCKCKYPSPVCVSCPARNEAGCAPVDTNPCCSSATFWLCPQGTTCNGDGTQAPYCR